MMKDIECPYCGHEQDIDHDDGYGYREAEAHEQECENCEKTFVYYTSIMYHYDTYKAPCKNGAEHKFNPSLTFPRVFTYLRCEWCDERQDMTEDQLREYLESEGEKITSKAQYFEDMDRRIEEKRRKEKNETNS